MVNDMKFVNVEKFEKQLKDLLNEKCLGVFNLKVWLDDLDKRYGETGSSDYEVGKQYTKSGNPELIDYEVEIKEVSEDEFETTIIF